MTAGGKTPRFRGAVRRWGALIVACLLLALLAALDSHLKHAGGGAGFHPAGASCVVVSPDFPSFCAKVADTDAAARFLTETPRPFEAFELAVRKATGVRPTPLRWDVWMGPRFVWSRWNGTQGMCAHPGLLLRAVHAWRSLWGARPDAEGVYACAGQYYAWRDGFLLVSPSPEYVKAALDSPLVDQLHEGNDTSLLVQWNDGDLRVHPEPGLPVEGTLNLALQSTGASLRLADAWPDDALLTLSTPTPEDALRFWKTAVRPFETNATWTRCTHLFASLGRQWALGAPAEGWTGRIGEFSAAVTGVDITGTVPVPAWGVRMRPRVQESAQAEHPWLPVVAPLAPIDYAWEGRPGCVATLMGERAAICLAGDGATWLATSQPALMSELLASEIRETRAGADAMLTINWKSAGKTAETLLKKAGELEIIPEMNDQEADAYLGKYARSFAHLGRLRIIGRARDGVVAFEGTLAAPEEEGSAQP